MPVVTGTQSVSHYRARSTIYIWITSPDEGGDKSCKMQIEFPDLWSWEILLLILWRSPFSSRAVTILPFCNHHPFRHHHRQQASERIVLFPTLHRKRNAGSHLQVKGHGGVEQERKELVILMEMSVYHLESGGEELSNYCSSVILKWSPRRCRDKFWRVTHNISELKYQFFWHAGISQRNISIADFSVYWTRWFRWFTNCDLRTREHYLFGAYHFHL